MFFSKGKKAKSNALLEEAKRKDAENKEKLKVELEQKHDFETTLILMSKDQKLILRVDEPKNKFVLMNSKDVLDFELHNGTDILDISIPPFEITATPGSTEAFTLDMQNSRSGLRGVKEINLSVSFNSIKYPYVEFNAFQAVIISPVDDQYVIKGITKAREWESRLKRLQKSNLNKEDCENKNSATAEIEKLFELKEKGIITEEEFKKAKEKLLA